MYKIENPKELLVTLRSLSTPGHAVNVPRTSSSEMEKLTMGKKSTQILAASIILSWVLPMGN